MTCNIEDAQYLQSVGEQQSYLFFVDSAQRDTANYIRPNQYDVVFAEPFVNAFSIMLLAAKVPRTQYLVDINNNQLIYRIDDAPWASLVVPPGDYSITQLVAQLNTGLSGIQVSLQTLQNRLLFTGDQPFSFDMTLSTIRGVLGFSEPVDPSSTGYAIPTDYMAGPSTQPHSHDVFQSIVAADAIQTVQSGPRALDPQGYPPATTRQQVTFTASGIVTDLDVLVTSTAAVNLPIQVTNLTTGAILAQTSLPVPVMLYPGYVSVSLGECEIQQGDTYLIDFPSTITIVTLYADDILTPNSNGGYDSQLQTYTAGSWQPDQDPAKCLCYVFTFQAANTSQQMLAPGVYNLTGERYISVQCKELTDHLYGSRAYDKWNAGLGVIDLGVYGYQTQSFDFSAYPPRTFFPCTLRKLSLSFHCADGSLYDFKGVDHSLTFMIKYYTAPAPQMPHQLINRNYNPDPQQAWIQRYKDKQDRIDQQLWQQKY